MKSAVMYEPCAHCPFRNDRPGFLTKARAREIVAGIRRDQHFNCHKTLDYSGENVGAHTEHTAICAGFAVLAERMKHPVQLMRIAERIGLYDPRKLNKNAPVHKTATAFIQSQPR